MVEQNDLLDVAEKAYRRAVKATYELVALGDAEVAANDDDKSSELITVRKRR